MTLPVGPWAIERRYLDSLIGLAPAVDIEAGSLAAADPGRMFELSGDGVATVHIAGPMLRRAPAWMAHYGCSVASTLDIADTIRELADDPLVDEIRLEIDSPGGEVAGITELADAIKSARESKTVSAVVPDMMASAALWVGVQAHTVAVGRSSIIGSIGVYLVVRDFSANLAEVGIKTHVVSSHELKGAGVFGSEITEAQIASWQSEIDALTDLFVADDAAGRGMTDKDARKLATGEVWVGAKAVAAGLADSLITVAATSAPAESQEEEDEMNDAEKAEFTALSAQVGELRGDLEQATAELSANKAEISAQAAAIAAQTKAATESIIAANRDRVLPSMIEDVREFAAFCGDDHAKLGKFLASLPVGTRPDEIGADGSKDQPAESDQVAQFASDFGISPGLAAVADRLESVDFNGNYLDADGKIVKVAP